ncbi:cyclic peptide export ABC transporter [Variovorax sp.]|uniref:cyclic peptide export ABC transporter n=1 Tax=Variovorax sp. TaxID=1871043 RepID=UPI002D42BE54|nr:cyclic peptide export ABC transporter [Variovorax sp.]HYP85688.1 cyclic peptide export ABC transporter [Variovorax sp.]
MTKPAAWATVIELLRLLRPYWGWLVFSALAGVAAGAATVALLAQINAALQATEYHGASLLGAVVGLCLLTLVARAASLISSNWIGQRLVAQVRRTLASKILAAPVDALERFRTHRLMPVLVNDVDTISGTVFSLSALAVAVVVASGCLLYLAWLSLPMFGLLMLALAAGTLVQQIAQRRSMVWHQRARAAEERLHKAYRGMSEGAKELRLHRPRRLRLYEQEVVGATEQIARVNTQATNIFVTGNAFGVASYFLIIAVLLAWSQNNALEPGTLGGFVLVLLYLKGPLDQIASILPALGRTRIALERIADLSERFATPETAAQGTDQPASAPPHLHDCIELRDVHYVYEAAQPDPDALDVDIASNDEDENDDNEDVGRQRFEVGPLNLRIDKGSIVFIVGDNGSGKTTLVKLLLGLYAPHRGQVLLDGQAVTPRTRDDYRQLFGTVFSDFYLFEELMGSAADGPLSSRSAQAYLERLQIGHKVSVRNGAFSSIDLSTGQRKRLALTHAYVEGRSVLVFDEWAADQDPAFRRLFYRELLPELRALGHTLVVISHDERYFDVADQLVRISEGRIVHDGVRPLARTAQR